MKRSETLGGFEQAVLLAVAHLGDDAYGVTAHTTVELLDPQGIVRTRKESWLTAGLLEQQPASWDDIADDEPAEHFGQVDVTLSLDDLEPGSYRLRVTTTDGANTSNARKRSR